MRQIDTPYEWVEINLVEGKTRTPEFLAKNPNGKVPLLELEDGRRLAESNAILCFLAEGTPYFPSNPWQRAKILEWMFFEQYSHEPYIATVRFWVIYLHKQKEWKDKIAEAMQKGYAALEVMERQLQQTLFLAGDAYSIADIALYAYTHVASDGGYDLSRFAAINRWLARVEAQSGYFRMSRSNMRIEHA